MIAKSLILMVTHEEGDVWKNIWVFIAMSGLYPKS